MMTHSNINTPQTERGGNMNHGPFMHTQTKLAFFLAGCIAWSVRRWFICIALNNQNNVWDGNYME